MINTIIYILFVHWFADFVVQTRWQAENKSKNVYALGKHVLTYSLTMLASLLILPYVGWVGAFLYVVVNGLLHFCTDFITSRITSILYKRGDIHSFFGMIGFDQFIHVYTLIITYNLLF